MNRWIAAIVLLSLSTPLLAGDVGGPPPGKQRSRPEGQGGGPRWVDRESEWKEAYEFFKANAPRRCAAFDALTDEKKKAEFRGMIMGRYGMLKWLARDERDKPVRDLKIKQMGVEDAIFGLRQDLKASTDPEEQKRIRERLWDNVKLLVESRIEERRLRIESFKRLVQEEEQRLAADSDRKDKLVQEQFDEILSSDGPDLDDRPSFRRGEREGGREGGGPPPPNR